MKNLILSFLLLISFGVFAQKELLSKKIIPLKSYDGKHLLRVALPMVGIGTGTVSLGGSGELRDCKVMNVPAKIKKMFSHSLKSIGLLRAKTLNLMSSNHFIH